VVYVVATRDEGEVAERVAVRIGRLVGDQVEVLEGLQGGERVVTEGAAYVRNGEPVRVVEAG
jgi:multidrug efflux pump subunit AcrA (membrane-fusion protein)